jgi:predicted metal-binding membrane protein
MTNTATKAVSPPLARERTLILGFLLILAAAAWALLIWQAHMTDAQMAMRPTMGMSAPLFIAIWVAMMVAMMFPTAAPMILMFARVHARKRAQQQPFVSTWVFVGAYMVVWALLGLVAYAAAAMADQSPWLMDHAAQVGGAILVAAGLYQLTPLKYRCLSQCRSPLAFVLTSWREGYGGAFRMGVEHGVYCAGCCWLLFVLLFPLGMLNIAALAGITALIFAEKSLPIGRQVTWLAAAALIIYGVVVLLFPAALPTTM